MNSRSSTVVPTAVLFLFWCTSASAVGQSGMGNQPEVRSMAQFARDLLSEDGPTRTYAGRVLKRRVKSARRLATRQRGDPVQIDTARQEMTDYDQLVAPKCIQQLSVKGVTRPCISILQTLETSAAIPALKLLLVNPANQSMKRRIRRALRMIGSTGETS